MLVLNKAFDILNAFSPERLEMSVPEFVAITGLPTSTCARIVRNLALDGMLERHGDRYRLGFAIVRWSRLALMERSVVEMSREALDWLRDESGEGAVLNVRDGAQAIVVAVAGSRHPVVRQLRIGEVSPLHIGSIGRAFLAFDPAALAQIKGMPLATETSHGITDWERLEAEIVTVRERGYAVSVDERTLGASGVSAPVRDSTGELAAVVSLSGPSSRVTAETIDGFAGLVLETARRISLRLGNPQAVRTS